MCSVSMESTLRVFSERNLKMGSSWFPKLFWHIPILLLQLVGLYYFVCGEKKIAYCLHFAMIDRRENSDFPWEREREIRCRIVPSPQSRIPKLEENWSPRGSWIRVWGSILPACLPSQLGQKCREYGNLCRGQRGKVKKKKEEEEGLWNPMGRMKSLSKLMAIPLGLSVCLSGQFPGIAQTDRQTHIIVTLIYKIGTPLPFVFL
jgi:hypothetical protein